MKDAPPSQPPPKRPTARLNQIGQTMGNKGLMKRRALIEATVALLETTPLRGLTVADIARRAGAAPPTFYRYFESVDEIVLEIGNALSHATPEILELLRDDAGHLPAADRSVRIVRAYLAHWDAHRALLRTRNLAAEEGDVRFIRNREQAARPLVIAFRDAISRAQSAGSLPDDIASDASARVLMMVLERLGAVSPIYRARAEPPFDALIVATAQMLAATLGWR